MITGELKNKVDSIWDMIWTGGITSPITVLEQITYLMFIKLLDDNQLKAEANPNALGVPLKNKVFQGGMCVISENPRIWFYVMNADGFSLDDKCSEIAGNDIPSACPTSSRNGAYI